MAKRKNKSNEVNLWLKRVRRFLALQNLRQLKQLHTLLYIALRANEYIQDTEISLKEFAKRMKMPISDAKNYLKGTYEYSLEDITRLECLCEEYLKEIAVKRSKIIAVASGKSKKYIKKDYIRKTNRNNK
jgi:hypothetical protein